MSDNQGIMMHIYRKTGNRLCGHIPRLMVLACCHAMTADGGHAQNVPAPAPVPAPVNAPGVAAGSVNPALPGEFPLLVAKEASLLGYWPLARNLDAAKGLLIIQSGKQKLVFRPGPQGQDASLVLSNGGYLTISPAEALDAPELTAELVCRIKYLTDGCLFGIRNGGATRFSLHYTTDMTAAEYKVEQVLEGEWKQPTITVLHWMIMDSKRLPIADRKLDTAVELSVERLDQQPQLVECRSDELEGDIDADLFYCESEAR